MSYGSTIDSRLNPSYVVRISSLEFSNSRKHNLIEQNQLTWISYNYNYSATGIQLDDQKTNNMNIVTILIWRCFNQEQERNPPSYQGLDLYMQHNYRVLPHCRRIKNVLPRSNPVKKSCRSMKKPSCISWKIFWASWGARFHGGDGESRGQERSLAGDQIKGTELNNLPTMYNTL